MTVWIMYDDSRARLPIAMADSSMGLALKTGANVKTIRSIASRQKHGIIQSGRFACVELGDDDDDYHDLHR